MKRFYIYLFFFNQSLTWVYSFFDYPALLHLNTIASVLWPRHRQVEKRVGRQKHEA